MSAEHPGYDRKREIRGRGGYMPYATRRQLA